MPLSSVFYHFGVSFLDLEGLWFSKNEWEMGPWTGLKIAAGTRLSVKINKKKSIYSKLLGEFKNDKFEHSFTSILSKLSVKLLSKFAIFEKLLAFYLFYLIYNF